MKIRHSQIINLPVETESGHQLGRVGAFNLDAETQSILEYTVRPSNLIKELIQGDFVINRGQVVEISAAKMVVDNNLSLHPHLKSIAKLIEKNKKSAPAVINQGSQ